MNAPNSWNPRFVAYARSRGMTPDEVVEADRTTFPGGCMAGYIVWNSRHISAYLTETKLDRNNLILFPDQYTEWLARRYARGQLALALEAS